VSPHYPVLDAKEVARILRKNGFEMVAQKGSHQNGATPMAGR